MLTTMTTADNPAFASSFFSRPTLHQPCFKMKNSDSDWEPPNMEEEMAEFLEKFDVLELDYDGDELKTEPEWVVPCSECPSKRVSRHLSGGGLLTDTTTNTLFKTESPRSQFSGCVVVANPQHSASDGTSRASSNPFRNEGIRKVLDAECSSEERGCIFSSTNPFRDFHESSLSEEENCIHPRQRSLSQSSTRPVSPTTTQDVDHFVRTPRPNSFIFALPAPPTANQSTQTILDRPFSDLQCLQRTVKALRSSGWYYENVSWQDSALLLQDSEPGTFLVRDSSDAQFLYTLSVQTIRGPTSVRLHYVDGRFRLDAEAKMVPGMPSFETVIDLVEFYIANSEATRRKSRSRKQSVPPQEQVWIDSNGQVYSHILLRKPLRRKEKVPSLQHLARLAVNRQLRRTYRICKSSRGKSLERNTSVPMSNLINLLALPQALDSQLKDYPYSQ